VGDLPVRERAQSPLYEGVNSPRPRTGDILWAWGQAHVEGVLAYY
jgi:hypothetical protein